MKDTSFSPPITEESPFKCKDCGATGEEKFSWDGNCLNCEYAEEQDFSCPICGQDPCCTDDYDSMEDTDVELP